MVTHDARAASIADRILFIADGLIVKELTDATASRRARGHEHAAVVITRRAQRTARAQASRGADGGRDRPRRRDGERHLHPHRHDQGGVHDRLHRRLPAHRRGHHRQERDRQRRTTTAADRSPSLPESLLAAGSGAAGGGRGGGRRSRTSRGLVGHNGKVIAHGGAPGLAFSYDPGGQRFNPLTLTSGDWPTAPDEVDIDAATAEQRRTSGSATRSASSRAGRSAASESSAPSRSPASPRSAVRRWRSSRCRRRSGCSTRWDASTRSTSPPSPGTSPAELVEEIRPLLGPSAQVTHRAAAGAAGDEGHERRS